jgi:hypothetical protein
MEWEWATTPPYAKFNYTNWSPTWGPTGEPDFCLNPNGSYCDPGYGEPFRVNETTTNAEPDNFPFCVFVPFHKAPRRYQSFCVEATKDYFFPF